MERTQEGVLSQSSRSLGRAASMASAGKHQVGGPDHPFSGGQDERTFNRVLQLAHVSRPAFGPQKIERFTR